MGLPYLDKIRDIESRAICKHNPLNYYYTLTRTNS